MRIFFRDFPTQEIGEIQEKDIKARYLVRNATSAPDTVRNELGEVRMFLDWAKEVGLRAEGGYRLNLALTGRRHKGKAQLHPHEARQFLTAALSSNDKAHLGAATLLLLGLRVSELTNRQVRDFDPSSGSLHILNAKTHAGNRVVKLPQFLVDKYVAIAGLSPTESLLDITPHEVRRATRSICKKLGLPVVCPHGLRGTHASIARQTVGTTGEAVARQLGHSSQRVTRDHYYAPGVDDAVARLTAAAVLVEKVDSVGDFMYADGI